MSLTNSNSTAGEGSEDPFARGGLPRSPRSKSEGMDVTEDTSVDNKGSGTPFTTPVVARAKGSKGGGSATPTPDAARDGAVLLKAMEKSRTTRPIVDSAAEQLDAIIDFVRGRSNIAKVLNGSLLTLRKTVREAKKEHSGLVERVDALEKARTVALEEHRELQARVIALEEARLATGGSDHEKEFKSQSVQAGGNEQVREHISRSVQTACACLSFGYCATSSSVKWPAQPATSSTASGAGERSNKRQRQSPGQETSGSKKWKFLPDPQPSSSAGPVQEAADAKDSADPQSKPEGPWIEVNGRKGRNKKKKPQEARNRRSKGDALILKTEEPKYAEVLKAMRGQEELKALGADVRSIRRTRTGEMILELRKDAVTKGPAYKALAEKVLGDTVEVRALTMEVTLQIKNLDEITVEDEVAQALKEQCEAVVPKGAVRLRKGRDGTQVAAVRLPLDEGKKALKTGSLKVGWSICPVSILQQPDICFRCLERGHKSRSCRGPDRSRLCLRCGGEGHKAKGCSAPFKCMICTGIREDNHAASGPRCPAGVPATK